MYFKRVIWFQIALFPDHSLGIPIVLITIKNQIRLAKDDHVSLNNIHKIRHKTIVIQCFIFLLANVPNGYDTVVSGIQIYVNDILA